MGRNSKSRRHPEGSPADTRENRRDLAFFRLRCGTIDTDWPRAYSDPMEIRLNSELQAKLDRLASESGRDKNSLVQEALERFMDYDDWFLREVEAGIAAADRGEFIKHEDILKLINQLYPGNTD